MKKPPRGRPSETVVAVWLGGRLRLPLPAPAEQTQAADAGGEEWESGGKRRLRNFSACKTKVAAEASSEVGEGIYFKELKRYLP